MKALVLYAGLGGESHLWHGVDVTKVELTERIADANQKMHPHHTVIVADAQQYLLDHYQEYDFIWASPPCQSHSRMIRSGRNRKPRYPDLRLYEVILFLEANFKGLWVVENVIPYYKPLRPATQIGRHLLWSNFEIPAMENIPEFKNFINKQNLTAKQELMDWLGLHYEENIYYNGNHCPTQVLRNCVHPDMGLHVLKAAAQSIRGPKR